MSQALAPVAPRLCWGVRAAMAIFAMLVCFGLAGCARSQVELKPGTAEAWHAVSVEGVPATEYLLQRWGIVLSGAESAMISADGKSFDARYGPDAVKRMTSGSGAAVHVGRGYWLTAAHCVPNDSVHLVRLTPLEPAVLPGRVVWRSRGNGKSEGSGGEERERDLALLRVDASGLRQPIPAIRLSAEPPASGRVLCLGSGLESFAWCGGAVTGVEAASDPDIRVVTHNAPVAPGDSGGPAMLESGELAGINILALPWVYGDAKGWALWIRPERLRRIIDDVEARGEVRR